MLKLRRGEVVSADPLTVEVAGERRRAWADEGLVGEVREGDEVVVNVEALDLGLGSGGFDVVHANLTRGLDGGGAGGAHVIKLNYTSLQHAVEPVEPAHAAEPGEPVEPGGPTGRAIPVLVLFLHGQLAPAAWATAQAAPGLRVGFVQTPGGALPGRLSRDVADLRERELLCGHVTAASAYGGEREAISVPGALHAAAESLGWEAAIAGPGPGILGSASALGHGGMAALDTAHGSLALGFETVVAPRLSAGDPRPRHRGLSHHAETVLGMLLGKVTVPVPDLAPEAPGAPGRAPGGVGALEQAGEGADALERVAETCAGRHRVTARPADLDGYAASGLPTATMGRELVDDRLFFASALAAGDALAALARQDAVDG